MISLEDISLEDISLEAISLEDISLEDISLEDISLKEISLKEISLEEISLKENPVLVEVMPNRYVNSLGISLFLFRPGATSHPPFFWNFRRKRTIFRSWQLQNVALEVCLPSHSEQELA
jgi:hypothetical protein